VEAYRGPATQQALYTGGAGVTHAPAMFSYHQYRLAYDVVPKEYLNLPQWNPGGPLWARIGALGKSLGLSWGGDWSHKDEPHFELAAAPIPELKAYWDKFRQIMPVSITPTTTTLGLVALAGLFYVGYVRPRLRRARLL